MFSPETYSTVVKATKGCVYKSVLLAPARVHIQIAGILQEERGNS